MGFKKKRHQGNIRSLFYLSVYICMLFIYGCLADLANIHDTDKPAENRGLETIPFYPKNSVAFDTNNAFRIQRQKEELEFEKKIEEKIEKKIKEKAIELDVPDPWLPPPHINLSKLPPAIRRFPKDGYGYPDWQAAARKGLIAPKGFIPSKDSKDDVEAFEEDFQKDIIFEINDDLMANVRFSHSGHSYWFRCDNCHPAIFIDKKGANPATMYDLWNGRYCGRCHGKVAFPMKGFKNCQRCHSVKKKTLGIK